jgi:hypothetical protein
MEILASSIVLLLCLLIENIKSISKSNKNKKK